MNSNWRVAPTSKFTLPSKDKLQINLSVPWKLNIYSLQRLCALFIMLLRFYSLLYIESNSLKKIKLTSSVY